MTEQNSGRVRLLGLSGSLRRNSYSTVILRELQGELEKNVDFEIRDSRLPLYNEDEDGANSPESVQEFRQAIAAADALVIVTPEYNHGLPGVLKNALDWASRPSGRSVLEGKRTLVISNSSGFTGGVRAQAQANETLLATSAMILPGRQVVIGGVADKIRDGRFIDKANLTFAIAAVNRLIDFCYARVR
jgi:chromate reductase, NAD(P)H dehydrogenase (quinone)